MKLIYDTTIDTLKCEELVFEKGAGSGFNFVLNNGTRERVCSVTHTGACSSHQVDGASYLAALGDEIILYLEKEI